MSDPRNVAHDKKVMNDKIHHGEDPGAGAAHAPQPGKKTAAAEKKHEPANHHHADQNYQDAKAEHTEMEDIENIQK